MKISHALAVSAVWFGNSFFLQNSWSGASNGWRATIWIVCVIITLMIVWMPAEIKNEKLEVKKT